MRRALVVLALCLVPTLAAASPAETVRGAVMFRGPSGRSPRVQHIPANAEIDVRSCGRIWCYGSWRGIPGFVRIGSLSFGPEGAPFGEPPPPPMEPVYRTWGWSYGFGIGNGW